MEQGEHMHKHIAYNSNVKQYFKHTVKTLLNYQIEV